MAGSGGAAELEVHEVKSPAVIVCACVCVHMCMCGSACMHVCVHIVVYVKHFCYIHAQTQLM